MMLMTMICVLQHVFEAPAGAGLAVDTNLTLLNLPFSLVPHGRCQRFALLCWHSDWSLCFAGVVDH